MPNVWVEFNLPQHVLNAIRSGDMKRRGGVIQHLNGQVKMWLKETGRWKDALEPVQTPVIPPQLASQMHALQMSTNIVMGLQVLNLGVMVAGFAILGAKLNRIDAKLDLVLREIGELQEEFTWLNKRLDAAVLAKLVAAMKHAEWAERTGRLDELTSVRKSLVEAEVHYQLLLQALFDNQRAHKYSTLFASYYMLATVAGMAKVRLDALLDGMEAGQTALLDIDQAQRGRARAFRDMLQDLQGNPHLMLLSLPERKMIADNWGILTETLDRVYSYGTEMDFCRREGIELKEWEAAGASDVPEDRYLVFVGPQG